jgi:hypothetical protein
MAHQIETVRLEKLVYEYQERSRLNRCSESSCSTESSPTDQKILRCAACKITPYCSSSCQKADWKKHKMICQHLSADLSPVEGSLDHVFKQITKREPKPSLFTDSKVFVCTNEIHHDSVVEQMKHLPVQGDTLVAVGATCGLNLAAARPNISHIVLLDVSKKTELFLSNLKVIILGSKDRIDCLKKIKEHLEKYMSTQYSSKCRAEQAALASDIARYCQVLESKESFLSSDESYFKIKGLFQSGHATVIEANLTNPEQSREISMKMKQLCLKVDSLYISNVVECAYLHELPSLHQSFSDLSDESTHIIDTKPRAFTMTKTLNKLMGHHVLSRITMASFYSAAEHEVPHVEPATQRVITRGNLFALYPQMRLFMIDRCCYKELYHRLGIESDFYTESQAANADRLLSDFLKNFDAFFSKLSEHERIKRIENLNQKAFETDAANLFDCITQTASELGF